MNTSSALLGSLLCLSSVAAHAGSERRALRWSVDSFVMELVGDDAVVATDQARLAAERAAEEWNAVGAGPQIILTLASDEVASVADYDGHNVVYFQRGAWSGIDGATAQTQRAGDASNGVLLEADVAVNAGEIHFTTDDEPASFDLQSTLTHELGHALGLRDDYENEDATMYFTAHAGDASRRTLTAHDADALQALYEGAELHAGAAGCSSTGSQGWWMALVLLAAAPLRRSAARARAAA